jgi:hypothetical protein
VRHREKENEMSENLIRDLEQAGHPDLAEALKNKELAGSFG